MKKIIVLIFFLIATYYLHGQKKDSVVKWVFEFNGGINNCVLDPGNAKTGKEQKKITPHFGFSELHAIARGARISFGASYHFFSYDANPHPVYSSQMVLFPLRFIICTNESKKVFLHLHFGAEPGFITSNPSGWKGFPIFLSAGGNLNYHFSSRGGAIEAGYYYSFQMNSFKEMSYTNSWSYFNNPTSGYSGVNSISHSLSYMVFYIGFKTGI